MSTTEEEHQHFHFFPNREVTSLYVTFALYSFAQGLISIFIPVYLWQLGEPLWRIVGFYFLIALGVAVMGLVLMPLVRRLSDKMMMFLSIPFAVGYFLGLEYIQLWPVLFYILPFITAIKSVFFNIGYHLDFSSAADGEHVGEEIGMRNVVSNLVKLASPFLGGLIIAWAGFGQTFTIAASILLLAVVPLFFFPKRTVSKDFTLSTVRRFVFDKSLAAFNVGNMVYAAQKMLGIVVWPLFLFFAVGSIEKFGGVISLGLLAGAIVMYLSGRLSDEGAGRKVLKISTVVFSLIWFSRTLLVRPLVLVVNHIVGDTAFSGIRVSRSNLYYHIARKTPKPGVFILSQEILFNVGRVLVLPIVALLAYLLPLQTFFIASFIIAGGLTLLVLLTLKCDIHNLDKTVRGA